MPMLRMPDVCFRNATDGDYPRFAELSRELDSRAPPPEFERWRRDYQAQTLVADQGGRVVGHTLYETFRQSGYVGQIIVEASARRRGIGLGLMKTVAAELRQRGLAEWALNVKPDNTAAIRLYEKLGMRVT